MKKDLPVSILFYLAAAYDGILGILFLAWPMCMFEHFEVTPPNHAGYVQFPAMLLIVFAVLFVNIARKPVENRNLIFYGILLKVSYCTVVFGYWFTNGIPVIWKPFAVCDLVFIILFILCKLSLCPKKASV
ncbi:MAG: hypothetical protein ABFR90_07360 [Planctomycetota bacterium]